MPDVELSDGWLHGLRGLNSTIGASGQPLRGNLCYEDLQEDFVDSPPTPRTRLKRDRFREALVGRRRLLEIGVNAGHSAYVALTDNLCIEFHGVDICEHSYVRPAIAHLQARFPGRVFLHDGDCRKILPKLARDRERFDAFHIDGAKHLYYRDILHCSRLTGAGSAGVIVDDTQLRSVAWVWRSCVRHGLIVPDPGFGPMPVTTRDQNRVGSLRSISRWRWHLLFHGHAFVPLLTASIGSYIRRRRGAFRLTEGLRR